MERNPDFGEWSLVFLVQIYFEIFNNVFMDIKARYVRVIVDELIKKTNQDNSKKGSRIIGDLVGLKENYLYTMHLDSKDENEDTLLRYHDTQVQKILKFLGHPDLKEFIHHADNPIDQQLISCLGSYYSFVRRSTEGDGTLFRSPAIIFELDGKAWIELRGKRLKYSGEVTIKKGVLYAKLESEAEKAFYHVYKIGDSQRPTVLQGTFTGVSTNFEPIAGRAVLIKSEKEAETLSNAELKLDELKRSKSLDERRLAEYFDDFRKNNLVINRVYTFDHRDLGSCK